MKNNMITKQCEYCKEFPDDYSEHVQSCKICNQYVDIGHSANSLKCLICTFVTDGGRSFIYKHILEIHQEDLEETSENPPNNQIEKLEEINAKKSKIPQKQNEANKQQQCSYCKGYPQDYAIHVDLCKKYYKFVIKVCDLKEVTKGSPKI